MQEASVPSSGVLSFNQTVAMQIQPIMIFISLILAFITLLTHWWASCSSFVYFLKLSAPFFIIIIFSVMCAVLEGQSDVTDRAILFRGSQAACLWMKKALWTSRDLLSFFIKLPVGQGAWESKGLLRKQKTEAYCQKTWADILVCQNHVQLTSFYKTDQVSTYPRFKPTICEQYVC